MGMFDSVMVPCPNCGTTNEFQSKGGDCVLATYSLEDAPFNVLGDVNRWPVSCRRCGAGYRVEVVVATARPVGDGSSMSDVNEIADELRRLPYGHRVYEAADEIERLNAVWNECSADKHRLLKEARALDAEVERLRGELADVTEVLGYRDRDIEKFRKGTLTFTAEVEQLQARVRELEARDAGWRHAWANDDRDERYFSKAMRWQKRMIEAEARVRELEAALREVVEHAEDMNSYDAGRVARAALARFGPWSETDDQVEVEP